MLTPRTVATGQQGTEAFEVRRTPPAVAPPNWFDVVFRSDLEQSQNIREADPALFVMYETFVT